MPDIDRLLDLQGGVIARRQLVAAGWDRHQIARMLRRRLWARVHEGVYVDHTGTLTWLQQAWAAVLFSWPAALSHESALRAAEGPGRRDVIETPLHVVVERDRHLTAPQGVRLHRRRELERIVQWNVGPPRVRYEQAVVDVAAAASSEFEAIALLSRAVQSRRTTARRLLEAISTRDRVSRRRWISSVLGDIADGTCSVLEHGYLTRVERPHGLPRAKRQDAAAGRAGRIYRDTSYPVPLVVELDGRLFHDSADGRDRDFDRDLLTQVEGLATTRLSWGQVFDRPCWTAAQIGTLLQHHGWAGSPTPCGPDCGLCG
ncbi:MAG: type IV toxin-antitoxin system AbiEi family antitoxin domain-containing protein [Jiangellaceae bacterium]